MFEKVKKLAEVGQHKLNNNSLIECPKCFDKWGVKKWERQAASDKLICPGCRAEHKKGTSFKTSYLEREFWQPDAKPNVPKPEPKTKVGAKATIKSTDKLIKKHQ